MLTMQEVSQQIVSPSNWEAKLPFGLELVGMGSYHGMSFGGVIV